MHVGLDFCSGVLGNGSVGGTVGSRPIPAGCMAGCMLGHYSDVAGVSLSDWPLRV